jgi:hypothetical protein
MSRQEFIVNALYKVQQLLYSVFTLHVKNNSMATNDVHELLK